MANSPTNQNYKAQIIRELQRVELSGQMPYQIFRDWCELVRASLSMLPKHLKSAAQDHRLADDPPDVKALFERMRGIYPKKLYFEYFANAMGILLSSAHDGYKDIIGDVYMEYSNPNGHNGQFFTPMSVARMMAQVIIQNGLEMVNKHLIDAFDKARKRGDVNSILLDASVIMSGAITDDLHLEYFMKYIYPLIAQDFTPVTISDPCCGSGVMFLAAAECFPRWAINLGLVQFSGQDIDPTCVNMAQINCYLYGLNGSYLQYVLAMSEIKEDQFPAPYDHLYKDAIEAQKRNDISEVEKIKEDVNRIRANQATLFDLSAVSVSVETSNGKNGRKNGDHRQNEKSIQIMIPEDILDG